MTSPTAGLDTGSLASELLAAREAAQPLAARPSERDPSFDLDRAFAVAEAIRTERLARGETVRGWKIGFTNRTIWDRYGVHAPIWGPVWSTTLDVLSPGVVETTLSLAPYAEPRLEPEIVFGLRATPRPGMDAEALASCIDWVAHGFEIVHTHCAGWRFTAADTVADFALHGRLIVGPRVPVAAFGTDLGSALESLSLDLHDTDRLVETGRGSNVLGGPLAALAAWVAAMAQRTPGWTIEPGHVVTTGTLTDAQPLSPGQIWRTVADDRRLAGLVLRTAD
jgi:2-oxo-3-hexenedioate decarboxylase